MARRPNRPADRPIAGPDLARQRNQVAEDQELLLDDLHRALLKVAGFLFEAVPGAAGPVATEIECAALYGKERNMYVAGEHIGDVWTEQVLTRDEYWRALCHLREFENYEERGHGIDGGPVSLTLTPDGWVYYARYRTTEDMRADAEGAANGGRDSTLP